MIITMTNCLAHMLIGIDNILLGIFPTHSSQDDFSSLQKNLEHRPNWTIKLIIYLLN